MADCNFQKWPQQYFWPHMLFQDLATSHQEVKSILFPFNWGRTSWLPQQKEDGVDVMLHDFPAGS